MFLRRTIYIPVILPNGTQKSPKKNFLNIKIKTYYINLNKKSNEIVNK